MMFSSVVGSADRSTSRAMLTHRTMRMSCLVVSVTRLVERDTHRVTTMTACLAAIDPVSALPLLSLMTPPQFLGHRWCVNEVALMMRLAAPGQRTSHRMVVVHLYSSKPCQFWGAQ